MFQRQNVWDFWQQRQLVWDFWQQRQLVWDFWQQCQLVWDSWQQRQWLCREGVFLATTSVLFLVGGRLGRAQILGFAKLRMNPHPDIDDVMTSLPAGNGIPPT